MHRSGTSAVARVVNLMGAHLGEADELLPAHSQDNPAGYWERIDLVVEHDHLLEATGHAWDRVSGFDAHHLDADIRARFQRKLLEIIGALRHQPGPWLVKDPRMSLLLPPWLAVANHPACIVVVRDPLEISSSMRHTHRGALTSQFPLALWEKYLRTLLRDLDGQRALFVSYADLLNEPLPQVERLLHGLQALEVGGLHEPDRQELSAFLDSNLRRSVPSPQVRLSAEQQALYEWLETQCRAPGPVLVAGYPEAGAPDALLAEFEQAFAYHTKFGREQAAQESRQRLQALGHELDEMRHLRNLTAAELANTQQQARSLEEDLEAERAEQERLRQRVGITENRIHDLTVKLGEIDKQRLAIVAELDQVRHERNIEAMRSLENERRIANLNHGIEALRSSISWKLTAPLRGLANLFALRLSANVEQGLYRSYYALPGFGPSRKRAFILWLHERAPWLTRRTLSYRLTNQTQPVPVATAKDAAVPRMDAARAETVIAGLARTPTISIVMPVYNVEPRWLNAAVDSVRKQFYPHWQLCIADDASTKPETCEALEAIAKLGDRRIRMVRKARNSGIAIASNEALKLATGDYVGLLDHDDALTRDALLEVVRQIVAADPDIIYSDEDKLDESGKHVEAHCKPDYSPDYFFSINYICHFAVLRRDLLKQIGGFRAGFDGAQDYDLLLRATEKTSRIAHIPKVLYHWRRIPGSTASTSAAKPQTSDAGRRALAESINRRGIEGSVETGPYPNTFRVRRTIAGEPLVSILIPFRDKPELLDTCVSSILAKTRYPHYEILCIDNGSSEAQTRETLEQLTRRDARVRVVRHDVPFNYSAINNFAAAQARGAHLLFLNNDTGVISEEWLDAMLEHSQRPEVGVVGARLWYQDGTIQHAGVIVGPGGVAGHGHLFLPGNDPGYFARIRLVQNLSAVTFACAMTRREVFAELGGLNERELKIAFNDVDYCLRAREAGYLVVYTPYALLHHYESKSRGYEDTPEKQVRFSAEIRYMQKRHATLLEHGDPYYNPRLSLTNSFCPDPAYAAELPR